MKNTSVGKTISSIYRHQSIIINNLFKDYEFGSGQYLFLIKINQNEGITQKDLSNLIHIDKANTNRAIKKLEKLGYIETPLEFKNKRNRGYFITSKGKSILKSLTPKLPYITNVLTRNMSESEKETLYSLLDKMEENVQTEVSNIRKGNNNEK